MSSDRPTQPSANAASQSSADDSSETPIDQLFEQSVTQGSPQYWAAHFTPSQFRTAVRGALCFAHAMNMLTTVSPEVIAEKSVWWHEELSDTNVDTARHPITRALLTSSINTDQTTASVVQAMHRHLHGALMSQQQTDLATPEAWAQYAQLRFGSLHELIALASGADAQAAGALGDWSAQLHALGVRRTPEHFSDRRVLVPSELVAARADASLQEAFKKLLSNRPSAPPANAVIIRHELTWWRGPRSEVPTVFAGLPVGLRGMLSSWKAARTAL